MGMFDRLMCIKLSAHVQMDSWQDPVTNPVMLTVMQSSHVTIAEDIHG